MGAGAATEATNGRRNRVPIAGWPHYCGVAHTPWGRIPGKVKGNTCWYPYAGKEHTTDQFELIDARGVSKQPGPVAHGRQLNEVGDIWCALATTGWGLIPGKAKDGVCWYPYGGKEHISTSFNYVI